MKTIHKYVLGYMPVTIRTVLDFPAEAKIVAFGMQQEMFCLWAELDPAAARAPRRFVVLPTGFTLEDGLLVYTYLRTTFQDLYVWHLYEVSDAPSEEAG